jgi:hypothetical protein
MAALCDGSAACATVHVLQVLQVLPWKESPSLTCLCSVLIVASFVGLDCLAFSWWPPYQIAARSLVKQVGGGPETTWVPGMLATFELVQPQWRSFSGG